MIEMKDVYYSYSNKNYALNGITLEIKDGSWVSILGHNGSGKSTIAKLLVGLLEPSKGEILIDGERLCEQTVDALRQKIGIVFQNPDNQFVGVTVKNDIAFGLENRCIPRKEMLELIEDNAAKVGLSDYLSKEPYKLSGGEKQRVAIAGILAIDSKYIIFDEATSMLDPKGVKDVVSIIKELKRTTDKTIITITHDLELAQESDYIFVLKEGRVTASGNPDSIFKLEDILNDSNLEIPFNTKLYQKVIGDDALKNDRKLVECLCQLNLKK